MRRGFTLVETLVAITILAIAIAGPMYAASRTLIVARNSNNQLTASHLAQEALEFLRLQRDNRYLASPTSPGLGWTNFTSSLNACEGAGARCTVDVFNAAATLVNCSTSCSKLNLTSAKKYTQGAGTATIFTRTVRVRDVMSSSQVVGQEITARVEWDFRGAPYFVEVKDILMPWQPTL